MANIAPSPFHQMLPQQSTAKKPSEGLYVTRGTIHYGFAAAVIRTAMVKLEILEAGPSYETGPLYEDKKKNLACFFEVSLRLPI